MAIVGAKQMDKTIGRLESKWYKGDHGSDETKKLTEPSHRDRNWENRTETNRDALEMSTSRREMIHAAAAADDDDIVDKKFFSFLALYSSRC